MKNKKTLYINFVSLRELKNRVNKVMSKKKTYQNKKKTIEFGDKAGYNRFMSFNKEVILSTIYNELPESIYELSDSVGRNYASVHRDCQALEKMGFIKLVPTNEKRGQVRPRLSFDYSCIQITGTGITIQLGALQSKTA